MHGIYLPTWMVDSYGKNVDKYTSPMDALEDALGLQVRSFPNHWELLVREALRDLGDLSTGYMISF